MHQDLTLTIFSPVYLVAFVNLFGLHSASSASFTSSAFVPVLSISSMHPFFYFFHMFLFFILSYPLYLSLSLTVATNNLVTRGDPPDCGRTCFTTKSQPFWLISNSCWVLCVLSLGYPRDPRYEKGNSSFVYLILYY